LTLGDKQQRIIKQIVGETLVIAIFSILISFVIATPFALQISQNMLMDNLIVQQPIWQNIDAQHYSLLRSSGFGNELSVAEAIELFNVSLSWSVTSTFVVGSMLTIALSTIIPMLYLTSLTPKELLLNSKIG